MKQVVIITQTKFINVQKIRLGISHFLKKKLKVRIFNISSITSPEYCKKYLPRDIIKFPKTEMLKNEKQTLDVIKNIDSKTFVLLFILKSNKTKFIYDVLEKKNIKYAYSWTGHMPVGGKTIFEIIKALFLFPISGIKKIISTYNNINYFKERPKYIFCAGRKFYLSAKKKFKNSEIIKIPSPDYDTKLITSKKKLNLFKNSKDYAVYIDMGYNHPDELYLLKDTFPPENPYEYNAWYNPLNDFFEKFINCTNLDLKIAAHPRVTYKKNSIKFGKIYFNKTIELISKCKIVLLHRSTAMHFAILFQKPLMFLIEDNHRSYSKRWTNEIADYFNKKPINLSDKNFNKKIFYNEMKFDKKIYSKFKKDFIVDITKPKKTSYEVMFNKIKNDL